MATIKTLGDALKVTSGLKMDQIKKMEKYNSASLTLTEKIENKVEPIFSLRTGEKASANQYGITLTTIDADGSASATIAIPQNMEKKAKQAYVKDTFGVMLNNLIKLEEQVVAKSAEFDKMYAELDKSIIID